VVSSEVGDIGKTLPAFIDTQDSFWKVSKLNNASGTIGTLAVNFSHRNLAEANKKALNLAISVAIPAMIIIAFVGLLIGYLLTRQLHRLTSTAQKLANGDFSAKTGLTGNDEVAVVGQTFDKMSDAIQKQFQEKEEQARNLEKARDDALQASRTKGAFLANMSHELRTPLNAIMGYTDLLSDDVSAMDPKIIKEDLSKIQRASKHLFSLIGDVLDLTKIEVGKIDMDLEYIDIEYLLEDVSINVVPLIEKRNNKLVTQIPETKLEPMYSDLRKIRQILIILLNNANKFTHHGEITLSVETFEEADTNNARTVFFVKDNGIGIAKEDHQRIFDQFVQVDETFTREYGGVGLGLTIASHFCYLLGGTISVESELGSGATFTVELPSKLRKIESKDQGVVGK
jgi:signal transduction histidine kinase